MLSFLVVYFRVENGQITFRIDPDVDGVTASTVAKEVGKLFLITLILNV